MINFRCEASSRLRLALQWLVLHLALAVLTGAAGVAQTSPEPCNGVWIRWTGIVPPGLTSQINVNGKPPHIFTPDPDAEVSVIVADGDDVESATFTTLPTSTEWNWTINLNNTSTNKTIHTWRRPGLPDICYEAYWKDSVINSGGVYCTLRILIVNQIPCEQECCSNLQVSAVQTGFDYENGCCTWSVSVSGIPEGCPITPSIVVTSGSGAVVTNNPLTVRICRGSSATFAVHFKDAMGTLVCSKPLTIPPCFLCCDGLSIDAQWTSYDPETGCCTWVINPVVAEGGCAITSLDVVANGPGGTVINTVPRKVKVCSWPASGASFTAKFKANGTVICEKQFSVPACPCAQENCCDFIETRWVSAPRGPNGECVVSLQTRFTAISLCCPIASIRISGSTANYTAPPANSGSWTTSGITLSSPPNAILLPGTMTIQFLSAGGTVLCEKTINTPAVGGCDQEDISMAQ